MWGLVKPRSRTTPLMLYPQLLEGILGFFSVHTFTCSSKNLMESLFREINVLSTACFLMQGQNHSICKHGWWNGFVLTPGSELYSRYLLHGRDRDFHEIPVTARASVCRRGPLLHPQVTKGLCSVVP